MRLRALLDAPDLRLRLLTGGSQLDRAVRWVYTTDLPDPRRYLTGGELVLTGMLWRHGPADSAAFVAALAEGGIAALAAGYADDETQAVPDDLVQECRRRGVVLFEVPPDVSFATVTERVVRAVTEERPGGAEQRWRDRLHTLVATGAGPDDMCRLLTDRIGADCVVLSAAGRRVAGTGLLPADDRRRLARRYLSAEPLPATERLPAGRYTLLAISPRQPRIAGWCLAVAGDLDADDPGVRGPVGEVCTLLALEWSRQEEARQVADRQGAQLVRLAGSDSAAPADVASRLQVAGFAPDEPIAVVVAAATGATPPTALLGEICAGRSDRSLVTGVDGESVAIVATDIDRFGEFVEYVRAQAEALRPGLSGSRVGIGVAAAPACAAGLHGALEEARAVRRLGEHRPGQVRVAGSGELTSHGLLLATVPDELRRSYTDRLLGPLVGYDAAHRTDLLATLEAFLDCDGSWTRCAARLHLHVNTLRYRIGRIERLTGRDLSTFPGRVDLYLALKLA
ncbi:hypothetical protein Athai_18170 [Actinocatenispora thailandica]|uniref:PucR family transcriptional regulator n=1 Tax=Actinocatenispora thailandica TaxID=227318 RepID=A0A7R7DM75_9ACTN|nr:PucR family transcriptional regulator [Actinocatenispora thailandica]BCJ34314.1 hypothetical protein Athai_18170 [Actinocatenispora thailandica]